jgi:bifunctional DNase/RNase
MNVPMELSRIVISELGDQQVIFLKEKDGERSLPIVIGIAEALAIDRRLKGKLPPRPMTHDLLANVIGAMGGRLDKIIIDDLQRHVFIATLHIRRGEEVIEVDSRPSDAIALGSALGTPIYVAEAVLDEALNENLSQEERVELLRQRMEELAERIGEIEARLGDRGFMEQAPPQMIAEHRRVLGEMQAEHDAIRDVLGKLP